MIDVDEAGAVILERDGSATCWRGDRDPSEAERVEDPMDKEWIPTGDDEDAGIEVELLVAMFRQRAETRGQLDIDRFLEECKAVVGKGKKLMLIERRVVEIQRDCRLGRRDGRSGETSDVDPVLAGED